MAEIMAVLAVALIIWVFLRVAARAMEAYRLMEAEERRQLHQAFMINFGGPCAPMFLDDNKYQHRRSLL